MKKLIFILIDILFAVLNFLYLDFFLSRFDIFVFFLGGAWYLKKLYVVFAFLSIPSLIWVLVRWQKKLFLPWLLLFSIMAFVLWICSEWIYYTEYLSPGEMVQYMERTGYLPSVSFLGVTMYVFVFLFWLMPLWLPQGVHQWIQRHALKFFISCLALCSLFFFVQSPFGRIGGSDVCCYQVYNEGLYLKLERQEDSVLVIISPQKDFSQIESTLLLIPPTEYNLYSFDYYGNGYVDVSQNASIRVMEGINCSQVEYWPENDKYEILVHVSDLSVRVYKFNHEKNGERRVISYQVK